MFWDKQPARMDHMSQGSSPWLVCDVIQSFPLSIRRGVGWSVQRWVGDVRVEGWGSGGRVWKLGWPWKVGHVLLVLNGVVTGIESGSRCGNLS